MTKPALPLTADILREISLDDLAETPSSETKAPVLRRLSMRHHRLARLLAEGFSPGQAAVAAGYELSRVSILQADPMFRELVRHYQSQVDVVFRETQERLADIAGLAAEEIVERLEESAESIDLDDLMKLVELGADRTGHAVPKGGGQSNVQVNFVGLGEKLEAAQRRMKDVTP